MIVPGYTFKVVHISASDHGHGGGDWTILFESNDIAEAVARAKKGPEWGHTYVMAYPLDDSRKTPESH